MIQSLFAQCQVCKQNMRLRIGLGRLKEQIHTFDCKKCNAPISVKLEIHPKTYGAKEVTFDNASMIERVDEYITYNLSQSIAIPEEHLHDDLYPFQLIENVRLFEDKVPKQPPRTYKSPDDLLCSWEEGQFVKSNCKVIDTALNMFLSSRTDNEIIKTYLQENFNGQEKHDTILHYLFEHNSSITSVGEKHVQEFDKLVDILRSTISENSVKYRKFHKYHITSILKERLREYRSLIKKYHDLYEIFNQIENYLITQTNVPENYVLSNEKNDETGMTPKM